MNSNEIIDIYVKYTHHSREVIEYLLEIGIIAGGSLVSILTEQYNKINDIDVYINTIDKNVIMNIIMNLPFVKKVSVNYNTKNISVINIEFLIAIKNNCRVNRSIIQLILVDTIDPHEIIDSYDMDYVQFALYNDNIKELTIDNIPQIEQNNIDINNIKLMYTERALTALNTRTVSEYRYIAYNRFTKAIRKGFDCLYVENSFIPMLYDSEKINIKFYTGSKIYPGNLNNTERDISFLKKKYPERIWRNIDDISVTKLIINKHIRDFCNENTNINYFNVELAGFEVNILFEYQDAYRKHICKYLYIDIENIPRIKEIIGTKLFQYLVQLNNRKTKNIKHSVKLHPDFSILYDNKVIYDLKDTIL